MKNNYMIKLDSFTRRFAGICFLSLLLLTCFGIGYTVMNASAEQVTDLHDVWTTETGNPFILNTFHRTDANDTQGKRIYYTLPEIYNDNVLMFRCRNMFVNIYINDQLVYEDNTTLHTVFGTSPGSRWHILSLNPSARSQTICIEGFACYEDSDGLIDNIYFGRSADVYREIVSQHFLPFLVSLFMLLVGIILLILCVAFHSRKNLRMDLFYLGIGVCYAAVWAITESLLPQLFFAHSEVVHLITYTSLITLPLPFALLAAHRFDGKLKFLSQIYAMINGINIIVISLLHVTGIKEYHYTLTPTHILLALLIPFLIMLILSYVDYKSRSKKTLYILIPPITIVAVCLIIALVEYLLGWFTNYSSYTQIAMVSFLSCLVFYHINQMVVILQKGMQADMLHKLALTDHLTGLYNRTALAEHQVQYLDDMMKKNVLGIIQFDVNNLKTVNDTLGHEKGDYLIQLVSEGLSTSFAEVGNCYRMGGDEFLVILTGNDPQKDYECGMRLLHTYCAAHNTQEGIEFPIVIAHGFVMEYGLTLSEAMEKADILMYKNKKALKHQI